MANYNMDTNWRSLHRSKFLLQYHIIFVCKYRKKLLVNQMVSDDIKQLSFDVCQKHNIIIHEMEIDLDHIHYMIETNPNARISDVVRLIKSYTTYHIWKLHKDYLSKYSGKNIIFGQMYIFAQRLEKQVVGL